MNVVLFVAVVGAFPRTAGTECIRLSIGTIAPHADVIFSGTVIHVGSSDVTFDVDRVWKGPVTKAFTIYQTTRVEGFEPRLGVKFLVLGLRASEAEHARFGAEQPPVFVLRGCESATSEWKDVSDRDARQLGRGRLPRGR